MIQVFQSISELLSMPFPKSRSPFTIDLDNFAKTMEAARKMLRLFESAKVYTVLLQVYSMRICTADKYIKILKCFTMIIYWAVDNLYTLSKLRILPFNSASIAKITAWVSIIAYISLVILKLRKLENMNKEIEKLTNIITDNTSSEVNQLRKLICAKKLIIARILQETADNIWILQIFSNSGSSCTMNLMVAMGNLLSGVMSLYMHWIK